eukprot:763056-Hanusia_phi.AAC.12
MQSQNVFTPTLPYPALNRRSMSLCDNGYLPHPRFDCSPASTPPVVKVPQRTSERAQRSARL